MKSEVITLARVKKKHASLKTIVFENNMDCQTVVYIQKEDQVLKFVKFESFIGYYIIYRTGYYGHKNQYNKICFDIDLMPDCNIIKFNSVKVKELICNFKSWASIANYLKSNIQTAKEIMKNEFPIAFQYYLNNFPDLICNKKYAD